MQFNNLGKQWEIIREESLKKIDKICKSGSFINGPAVSEFEKEFAKHYETNFAVGVSNGTDGLKLSLQTYDLTENDLVIIPSNTFIADYLAIKNLPLGKPKVALIDHDEYFTMDVLHLENFLKKNRTNYNKVVIIPVHLYGHSCDMDTILKLSQQYNCSIIEDCSQSHETKYKNKYLGNYGDMSVYSLYPGKNLGAAGDAGVITTNNPNLYERLKSLRNYGSKVKYEYDELGHNHRLDSIQATILTEKLKHITNWTQSKITISNSMLKDINNPKVILPSISVDCTQHSFHIMCLKVENRVEFEKHLSSYDIPTIIHYPIPIHKTKIWESSDIVYSSDNTDLNCSKIISIPLHPFMTEEEIKLIIDVINKY
jgi:dTDP-4-amino-4,6-dideoxygalactose transaminase